MIQAWRCKHDDVTKWKHFAYHWPLRGGIHRWPVDSPHKASDVELLCFLCAPDQTVEQTVEAPVILSAIMSMWRHYNEIVHWQGHPILVVNVTAYICFNHAVIRETYWWPSHVSMILNSFARIPLAVACARNQYLQSVLRSIIRCVTYIYAYIQLLRLGRSRESLSKPPFFMWSLSFGILSYPTSCSCSCLLAFEVAILTIFKGVRRRSIKRDNAKFVQCHGNKPNRTKHELNT